MRLSLCSFGRSLLCPVAGRVSLRRVVWSFRAAASRWPGGHLALRGHADRWGGSLSLLWVVADGSTGLLLSGLSYGEG